jgi:hypothetical protein
MKVCRHCGEQLGIIRLFGSEFCSRAHEQADQARMQRLMIERVQQSASRFQAKLLAAKSPQENLSEIYHQRYMQLMNRLSNAPNWKGAKPASEERALVSQA